MTTATLRRIRPLPRVHFLLTLSTERVQWEPLKDAATETDMPATVKKITTETRAMYTGAPLRTVTRWHVIDPNGRPVESCATRKEAKRRARFYN